MSNKVPISGVVEQVSDSGFKVAGRWFNKARTADKYQAPTVGQTVTFDAYGQNQNVVYQLRVEGNGNGVGPAAQPVASATNGAVPVGVHRSGSAARDTALMAAATLLQGSEGNVEQVASNCVAIARIFEVYLGGKQTQQEEEMI